MTNADAPQTRRSAFVWAWAAPGTLFFALLFLNFANNGYLLVLFPLAFAFLADRLSTFVSSPGRRPVRWATVAAGIAANVLFFFCAPVCCSYRGVREFDKSLTPLTRDFEDNLNPEIALIGASTRTFSAIAMPATTCASSPCNSRR